MTKISIISIGLSVAVLTGCASQPTEIPTSSVSSFMYQKYDCDQVAWELARVDTRVGELHASLKKTADRDAIQMGVGLILFWPTLFALEGGDGAEAGEYGRLKGEKQALEKVAVYKKCALAFKALPEKADGPGKSEADKDASEGGKI